MEEKRKNKLKNVKTEDFTIVNVIFNGKVSRLAPGLSILPISTLTLVHWSEILIHD